jgi:hypothetical protein
LLSHPHATPARPDQTSSGDYGTGPKIGFGCAANDVAPWQVVIAAGYTKPRVRRGQRVKADAKRLHSLTQECQRVQRLST